MLKRLIAYLKSLFQKPAAPSGTSAVEKPAQATAVLSLDTREGWEAWRNSFPPSTQSFISTWEQKLERDRRDAANSQGQAVDRSGFELTEANGWLVTPTLRDGELYPFTLGKPGTVRVFGVGGNQLKKVNGQAVVREAEIPGQSGTITLAVESVDGRVGVQVI